MNTQCHLSYAGDGADAEPRGVLSKAVRGPFPSKQPGSSDSDAGKVGGKGNAAAANMQGDNRREAIAVLAAKAGLSEVVPVSQAAGASSQAPATHAAPMASEGADATQPAGFSELHYPCEAASVKLPAKATAASSPDLPATSSAAAVEPQNLAQSALPVTAVRKGPLRRQAPPSRLSEVTVNQEAVPEQATGKARPAPDLDIAASMAAEGSVAKSGSEARAKTGNAAAAKSGKSPAFLASLKKLQQLPVEMPDKATAPLPNLATPTAAAVVQGSLADLQQVTSVAVPKQAASRVSVALPGSLSNADELAGDDETVTGSQPSRHPRQRLDFGSEVMHELTF